MQCKNFDKANLDECVSLYIDVFLKEPWCEQNCPKKIKEYFLMLLEMNAFLGFMLVKDSQIIGLCLGYIKPYIFRRAGKRLLEEGRHDHNRRNRRGV